MNSWGENGFFHWQYIIAICSCCKAKYHHLQAFLPCNSVRPRSGSYCYSRWCFTFSSCSPLHPFNFVGFSLAELKDVTKRFSSAGVSNYTTLTLADPKGLLYVGAREAIFALSTSSMEPEDMVSWGMGLDKEQATSMCRSFSFHRRCRKHPSQKIHPGPCSFANSGQ